MKRNAKYFTDKSEVGKTNFRLMNGRDESSHKKDLVASKMLSQTVSLTAIRIVIKN